MTTHIIPCLISPHKKDLLLVKKGGGHCGCCTYLEMMDPILHTIIAEKGSKLKDPQHCKCCRYWRAKGIHQDINKAKRIRRGSKS